MYEARFYDECAGCERRFMVIESGGPCGGCHLCCDCCSCHEHEVSAALEDKMLCRWMMADAAAGETPLALNPSPNAAVMQTEAFRRNMVKIAIWPFTMSDEEIRFDRDTGCLTDECAERIEHYLRLNLGEA